MEHQEPGLGQLGVWERLGLSVSEGLEKQDPAGGDVGRPELEQQTEEPH